MPAVDNFRLATQLTVNHISGRSPLKKDPRLFHNVGARSLYYYISPIIDSFGCSPARERWNEIRGEIKGKPYHILLAKGDLAEYINRIPSPPRADLIIPTTWILCLHFRITLLVVLPNLKRINKLAVTLEERRTAEISAEAKWREIMEEDSEYLINTRTQQHQLTHTHTHRLSN